MRPRSVGILLGIAVWAFPAATIAQPIDKQQPLDAMKNRIMSFWTPPPSRNRIDPITIRVELKLNGSLAGPPTAVAMGSGPLYLAARDSAVRAIIAAQPYTMLRPEVYDVWKAVEITFDQKQAVNQNSVGDRRASNAAVQSGDDRNGNAAKMKLIQANPSSELLEYQAAMMPIQRALQKAFYAGICQFRSEAYFRTFLNGSIEISQREATKRNLSNDEIMVADNNAKQIIRREDTEAGLDADHLEARCRVLRSQLDRLDAIERTLTGNYH